MRILLIALVLASALTACVKGEKADVLVHNAKIYALDGTNTIAEAMAIRDGRIIELGAERQIMNKYGADEIIDARKQAVFPGLIDAHCHFMAYGLGLSDLDLRGTASFEEVLKLVEKAEPNGSGWITGRGWDQNDWEDKSWPTNDALNALFPSTPVLLRRVDGHAALANQAALAAAGIDSSTVIEGGLVQTANGRLTGILLDNAAEVARDAIPAQSEEGKKQALLTAQQNCFAVGLTTIDDAGLDKADIDLIQQLHASGELKMRIYAMVSDKAENFEYFLKNGPISTDRLTVRSFKFYGDGALGSRGACLLEPYADGPDSTNFGFLLNTEAHYRERMAQLLKAGFQVNTHCIGDSANRLVLNIYSSLLEPKNDKRWRIEHAQVVHPADVHTFGEYAIIASVQPTHATSDMYWAGDRLGPERVTNAYAYKTLNQQLGFLPLGTDFPVEDISPFKTFYAAVVRKDANGYPEGGYQPENALTREEALRGMTIGAAIANFEEFDKGTLEPGKLADFVIVDRDLLTCPEKDLLGTQVIATYINGECVYSQDSSEK